MDDLKTIAISRLMLDNVPHNGLACVGHVQDFFAKALHDLRAVASAA